MIVNDTDDPSAQKMNIITFLCFLYVNTAKNVVLHNLVRSWCGGGFIANDLVMLHSVYSSEHIHV